MSRSLVPLPTGETKAVAVRSMFDAIAGRYDFMNRLMTFGMDRSWRHRAAGTLGLKEGSVVLDLACGTGDFLLEARARKWNAIGIDFSLRMLMRASERGFQRLVHADALAIPLSSKSVDGITCGFALRNVSDLPRLFDEMARVLKPGGRIALLETCTPSNAIARSGHALYFNKVVPFLGSLLSNGDAYSYLPRSVAYLPGPLVLQAMLERSGFGDVHQIQHFAGVVQTLIGTRQ